MLPKVKFYTFHTSSKSWRKAEADAAAFSEWGGSVSGKLGKLTENGFEVVDAGIKVFEKKAKESKEEVTAVSSEAMPV